jgi:hypothetical protein
MVYVSATTPINQQYFAFLLRILGYLFFILFVVSLNLYYIHRLVVLCIPFKNFGIFDFLFDLLLVWTYDKRLIIFLVNVVATMWIEYLSKFIFWELHSHIDKMLLCLNFELVIKGRTHSIISKFYYWVIHNTCDSWDSYFGELHGTFNILTIIGLNECWFIF